ncbi:MAG: flagellar hook-length control protein FliK [Eubacteriales bacterium]|nr:flagellar hook-length control protein FliK [Eubacteriales bacterium]
MVVNEKMNANNLMSLGNAVSKKQDMLSDTGVKQNSFASYLKPAGETGTVSADTRVQKKDNLEKTLEKNQSELDRKTKDDVTPASEKYATNYDSSQKPEKITTTNSSDNVENEEGLELDNDIVMESYGDLDSPNDEMDVVLDIVSCAVQQLCEQLQIAPDDLKESMDELSLGLSDVLSEEGLKTVFLDVKDAEISDLLVDETLNTEWTALTEVLSDTLADTFEMNEEQMKMIDTMDVQQVVDYLSDDNEPIVISDVADNEENNNALYNQEIVIDTQTQSVANGTDASSMDLDDDNQSQGKEQQTQAGIANQKETKHTYTKKTEYQDNSVLESLQHALDQTQDIQNLQEAIDVPVSGKEIVSQIVEQITVRMNQDHTAMEMQLYPEHLGKIQINVVSKDGVMTARIVAETEAAKQAIESGLTNLKESMEQQNLKVDAIEVMVSTTGFEQGTDEQGSYEQQRGSQSGRKLDLSELDEMDEASETAESVKMEYSGSSVSYMA